MFTCTACERQTFRCYLDGGKVYCDGCWEDRQRRLMRDARDKDEATDRAVSRAASDPARYTPKMWRD